MKIIIFHILIAFLIASCFKVHVEALNLKRKTENERKSVSVNSSKKSGSKNGSYEYLVQNFLKIKFINSSDGRISPEVIENQLHLSTAKTVDNLGKMLASIAIAVQNGSPENKYAKNVLDNISSVYKNDFQGNFVTLNDSTECSYKSKTDKNLCMPGTHCTNNKCLVGLKEKLDSCKVNWECGSGLICKENKCEEGEKASELPNIHKMELRLSEVADEENVTRPTLVRHQSELGSFYIKKEKFGTTKRNTEQQNDVRKQLLNFILDNDSLRVEFSKIVSNNENTQGTYNRDKAGGIVSLKTQGISEDSSNHELMHFADYIIGKKELNKKKIKANDYFELFLSWQLIEDPKFKGDQKEILDNLVDALGYGHYKNNPVYSDLRSMILEVPTNLLQEKGYNLSNLNAKAFEFVKEYANQVDQLSQGRLSEIKKYILNKLGHMDIKKK